MGIHKTRGYSYHCVCDRIINVQSDPMHTSNVSCLIPGIKCMLRGNQNLQFQFSFPRLAILRSSPRGMSGDLFIKLLIQRSICLIPVDRSEATDVHTVGVYIYAISLRVY